MSCFHYGYEAFFDRLIEACFRILLADPEQAGVHHGPKGGAVPLADWRAWILAMAAEASRKVLAYQANPVVIPVLLGGDEIPFPVAFKVTTPAGDHFVSFDMPGLDEHELAVLFGLAAASCKQRLVHITDADLDAFVETGRFPCRSPAAPMFGSEWGSAPPIRR